MAADVIVPEVGEIGMDVTFVRWLKAEGDAVAVGDPIFEVDTEKSVMVVEAYAAGTLAGLTAAEGDDISPRQVIGRILADGEEMADPNAQIESTGDDPAAVAGSSSVDPVVGAPEDPATTAPPAITTPAASRGRRAGVSPRARRVARKLGVDLDAIAGSGPDGLITEADVRAGASEPQASQPPVSSTRPLQPESAAVAPEKLERARRAVAQLTTSSWQSIPHFYLQLDADVDRGLDLAKPTPLICTSLARALVRHPECNLAWDGDRPVRREGVDLGLLVDTPQGLLIAVVGDAHELDLAGMSDAIRDAATRARSGKLAAVDSRPRSLTVSNLGMFAVDRFAAVIPTPDVMALAVGRTRPVPRWDGEAYVPTRTMDLTLSVDHRALDGAAAAGLLSTLESILGDPSAQGLA